MADQNSLADLGKRLLEGLEMIAGGIWSFLMGSGFRMIWGELSAWWTARTEQKNEIERIKLEGQLAAEQHGRQMEAIRLQHELGADIIRVQGEQARIAAETTAWGGAVIAAMQPTGIRTVDAWNASIRPAFATLVLFLWCMALYRQGWTPTPWDLELMSGVAGFFFADRSLGKRGK